MNDKPLKCQICGAPLRARGRGETCRRCLFEAALQNPEDDLRQELRGLPATTDRQAYIQAVCADDPALAERLRGWLEDETVDLSSSPLPEPSRTMDRYKLLEKLGEGGFGEVWMAEQREPVKRRVALKIIKPGMDTRQVVARFEAERQALALMDHPNIARVFDGGATETGRPYFVMELVRGAKITEYCDQHALPTRERLKLFILVCQAIQHAHQKGIIHRDIKPSNILVTLHDGAPVPKVIDFGIAKATQGDLTDQTFFTQFQHFIGTPAYISPEQAEASGLDIDTRSDIYSLGVLLYELLAGSTPFDARELVASGIDAMRKTIREKEPQRPSTKLSQTLVAADSRRCFHRLPFDRLKSPSPTPPATEDEIRASSHRLLRLKETIPQLKGDLDWIVMKCLEKDRTRRYETANALSLDIQRYLANEPVLARPPSAAYRLQKTWQRNKLTFMAGSAVALALVVGTGVSLWQAAEARQSRNAAEAARNGEVVQRVAAEKALRQEASERQRAAASEQEAQGLLYVANMNLIRQAWEENNLGRIRQLLDETAGSTHRGFEWYYWQRMVHLDFRTFFGHSAGLWSAGFSPDGRRMVTASKDGTAKVWEVSTGRELLTLSGHADWVRSAAFSPDGRRIVTASKDYIARIWDVATGSELRQLRGHRGAIRTAAFSPDGQRIVTAGQDRAARVWDVETGTSRLILRGHSNWVFSAAYSGDGRRIVTSGDDKLAKIWDASDGRELRSFAGHAGFVRTAAFSPDSRQVVTASQDQTAKVWEVESGQILRSLSGHAGYVFSAAFSPDGAQIVTTSGDQTVRIWEAETGRELNQLRGHSSEVYTAIFSPEGRQILTASDDGTAKVWDAATAPSAMRLEYGGKVLALAISPDSQHIVAGGDSGKTKVWDAATGELLRTFPGQGAEVRAVAFSADGQRIATAHDDGKARLWLAATGRLLLTLTGHIGGVNSIAFSADGQKALTAGSEGNVKVWSLEDGHELLSLPRAHGQTFSAAFSPDGSRIVSSFESGAKVWDVRTGTETLTLDDLFWVRSVTFSPDSRALLLASADKTAEIRDARHGERLFTLRGHTLAVLAASFAPDGQRVVTTSRDRSAKVWEAATGKELLSLHGHTAEVNSTTFSPDGQSIVTGSLDGTVRVWKAALPREVVAWDLEKRMNVSNRLSTAHARPLLMARANRSPALQPGLITQWLLLAPLEIPAPDTSVALDMELIPDEARIGPRAGDRVRGPQRDLVWEPVEQASSLLDFNDLVGKASSPQSVAYAVCYLVTDSPELGLVFKVSSDDECKVYLNGRAIHRSNPNRGYVLDEETINGVELRTGTNTVVFKVLNDTERWLGSLRVLDDSGQPVSNVQVTLTPDVNQ